MTDTESMISGGHVKTDGNEAETNTLNLESYAQILRIERQSFDPFGLRSITTPAGEAIEIPYRHRDGTEVARRIRRSLSNGAVAEWVFPARAEEKQDKRAATGATDRLYLSVPRSKKNQVKELGARWDALARRWYVPSGSDPKPFERWLRLRGAPLLYGLENMPERGCPLFLVVGEPACHVLWQHGFDAVGLAEAESYNASRDDPELEDYDVIVLIGMDELAATVIEHLSMSSLRHSFKIAELDVVAAVEAGEDVTALIKGAGEVSRPLEELLAERTLLDRLKHPERGEIVIRAGERPRVVDEAIAVIQARGTLYERGGELVRLCQQVAVPVEEHWLADYLGRHVAFYRERLDRNGEFLRHEADPPTWLCKTIAQKRGERGLKELTGVITAPTLRPDGTLLKRPGFDEATGLLLRPGAWPRLQDRPNHAALEAAWAALWKPIAEFPYASTHDRGVTVAAMLTATVRRTLPKAPAFSFDAPVPASGKTLLATCVAEVAGGDVAVVPECREEEELRKRLLASLREGQPSILLDNIKGQFASSALEAFLTDDYYADRVLGVSQILRLPTNILVLISGNNFIPRGDLWRRIVTARIDPRVEHAERRSFRLDARKHCREHRQELVAAALTLLCGFINAGKPRFTKDRLASFEEWDDLIRQCVLWLNDQGIAELGDPTASIGKAKELEPERQKLGAFLEAVRGIMGAGERCEKWRTNDLIQKAEAPATDQERELRDVLREIAGERNSINPRVLGRWIERQTDAWCGGLCVERAGERHRAILWRVIEASQLPPDGT